MAEQFDELGQALRRVGIVVNHEHMPPVALPLGRWRSVLIGMRCRSTRERDDELRTVPGSFTLSVHRAAMQLDDPFDERKSKSESAFGARQRALGLHER